MQLGRIGPIETDRGRVRAHCLGDALEEPLTQRLDGVWLGQEGGRVVERSQFSVALGQAASLVPHLGFEASVQVAQTVRHVVEPERQLPELVAPAGRQAHAEVGRRHAFHALTQALQRLDDHQKRQNHQRDRAGDRHARQPELEHAQQVGPARQVVLDAGHQSVDRSDEVGDVPPGHHRRPAVDRLPRHCTQA